MSSHRGDGVSLKRCTHFNDKMCASKLGHCKPILQARVRAGARGEGRGWRVIVSTCERAPSNDKRLALKCCLQMKLEGDKMNRHREGERERAEERLGREKERRGK